MKLVTSAVLWVLLYLALAVAPLFVALIDDPPPGRDGWTEFSVALGFIGLAVLGLQFAVTARSTVVDAPYGLDVVLRFHKLMSLVGFGLVFAHPLVLFVAGTAEWTLLNVLDAPWRARMGVLSLAALVAMIVTSLWRLRLRLRYEMWRLIHGVLAAVVMVAGLVHVEMVGHYVSGPWRRVLWAVMSLVVVALLVWVRVVRPILILRRPWRVVEVLPRASDTWSLVLAPDGHEGLRFDAGQFAWITLGRSSSLVTEHPFSFSSSSERTDRVEFTIKAAGDFTSRIGSVEPGTVAYLDGPYGVFTLRRNEGPGFLFIAGGIGITPILSMLRSLADLGDRRRMTLLYANNDWGDVPFVDELEDLQNRLDLRVVHVVATPPDPWPGETGFVTADIIEAHLPARLDRIECFLCGPPPMMGAVTEALRGLGVPAERIHNERFDFI